MEALLAVGSNVEPDANVPLALRYLEGLAPAVATSHPWRTPPHGPVEGGPFVNLAVHVRWHGDLDELRHALKRVERRMGRQANTSWKARPLDVDIVAVRDKERKGWTLIDAEVDDKPFLWRPLAEVAPTLNLGNRSAADLARSLGPEDAVLAELAELRTR